MATAKRQLFRLRYFSKTGEDFDVEVKHRRTLGESWETIARWATETTEQTVSDETLRQWFRYDDVP